LDKDPFRNRKINPPPQSSNQMRTYRCFTLNKMGLIARREDIDAPDDKSALEEGWRRVSNHQQDQAQSTYGLELWLGLTLVFTTRDHIPI
jgi:hypothetical protein